MPLCSRVSPGWLCQHLLTRGSATRQLAHKHRLPEGFPPRRTHLKLPCHHDQLKPRFSLHPSCVLLFPFLCHRPAQAARQGRVPTKHTLQPSSLQNSPHLISPLLSVGQEEGQEGTARCSPLASSSPGLGCISQSVKSLPKNATSPQTRGSL